MAWAAVHVQRRIDPQAFIQFFEKIDALEKHKPGTLAKVFADHPQTLDRIADREDEIATIMPARPDYVGSTSEFDDVKARLARIENKRKINDGKGGNKPTLRRVGGTNNDPDNPNSTSSTCMTARRRDVATKTCNQREAGPASAGPFVVPIPDKIGL